MNDENPKVKSGLDLKLEAAASHLLKSAAASTNDPVELVFGHSCGLNGACQCKKWISITEAETAVQLGAADWLSDFVRGLSNPPQLPSEKTYKAIVYRRGTDFPRATVTGAPHITHLMRFKSEEAQRQELLRRAIAPENNRLVNVVETWPEYQEIDFENDEYIVWMNAKPYVVQSSELFHELAAALLAEINKSPEEVKQLFEHAEEKIQKHHRGLIRGKVGIYASWKNMPDDFNILPVKRMQRTLNVLMRVISIPEFKRLSGDQQVAIRAYIDGRLNYRNAAGRAKISENTLRDRVQAGYANLGRIREKGNISAEFRQIQIDLFGGDIQSAIDSAEDREQAMQNKSILATGGDLMGMRVVSRGTRVGADGQLLQKRLDTLENSEFTVHETDGPREHEASGHDLPTVQDDFDN